MSPQTSACLLPLSLCKPLALAEDGAVLHFRGALTSQSDENAYCNTENREQAHLDLLLLACRHRSLAGIMRPGCFWVLI